jgi:hypothetical protein
VSTRVPGDGGVPFAHGARSEPTKEEAMSAHPGTIGIPTRRVGSRGWRFAVVVGAMIASAAAGAFTGRITAPPAESTVVPAVETVPNPAPGFDAPDDSPAGVHGRQIAR